MGGGWGEYIFLCRFLNFLLLFVYCVVWGFWGVGVFLEGFDVFFLFFFLLFGGGFAFFPSSGFSPSFFKHSMLYYMELLCLPNLKASGYPILKLLIYLSMTLNKSKENNGLDIHSTWSGQVIFGPIHSL